MPKETIKHDPNEPMRAEYISSRPIGEHANYVIVGWGKGMGTVQIGVEEPDAIPGEREGGHFANINPEQIDQIVASLKRAKRQAFNDARSGKGRSWIGPLGAGSMSSDAPAH